MIRRDFIMRQVQTMAQALARALFLRAREDYEAAIDEIGRALRTLGEGPSGAMDTETLLRLCHAQEAVTGPLMLAVGALVREQALSLENLGRTIEAKRARATALTLQIEALLVG